jgi:hypothetical protein
MQPVFNTADIVVLHENAAFGFCIKSLAEQNGKFKLIFTEGLSKYLQPVDEKNKQFERIELYFLLPDYWDISQKKWPVYWLNRIAQVPQKNKTWFGAGDTLPVGNPPAPIDEHLKCSYFILSQPLFLSPYFAADLWKDTSVSMLAVIPIFEKEFDYKNQNSAKALLQIFEDKGVTEMIDLYRQPMARKKFMGLF